MTAGAGNVATKVTSLARQARHPRMADTIRASPEIEVGAGQFHIAIAVGTAAIQIQSRDFVAVDQPRPRGDAGAGDQTVLLLRQGEESPRTVPAGLVSLISTSIALARRRAGWQDAYRRKCAGAPGCCLRRGRPRCLPAAPVVCSTVMARSRHHLRA